MTTLIPKIDFKNGGTLPTGAINRPVNLKLEEQVSVLDFGAIGDGTADDTVAFQNALTYLANGGVLLVPSGRYKLTDTLVLNTGITIQGQGDGDRTFGIPNVNAVSSYIYQTTPSKSVFSIGGNKRNIRIFDISLGSSLNPSTTPSAFINGIYIEGTYPNSSTDLIFERCSFYNFKQAITVNDPNAPASNPDWQCDCCRVISCEFMCNSTGVLFNSTNADAWLFETCQFLSGITATGILFNRVGFTTLINCFGGCATTSSPTNVYGLTINGFTDTIKLINCQWENSNYMLAVNAVDALQPTGDFPIILDSCIIEAPIILGARCHYISIASRYTQNVTVPVAGVIIESICDFFDGGSDYLITNTGSSIQNALPMSTSSVPALENGWVLGGRKQALRSAPPPTGTYAASDTVWNNTPNVGSPIGWVCSASGTPGTWQAFGQIGSRSASGSPVGSLTPFFLGEEYLDTGSNKWYKSIGSTNTSWVALN